MFRFLVLETESQIAQACYAAEDVLELLVLLPPVPQC